LEKGKNKRLWRGSREEKETILILRSVSKEISKEGLGFTSRR